MEYSCSHIQTFGCKLTSASFINMLLQHDIIILSEAWGCNPKIFLPGYLSKIIIWLADSLDESQSYTKVSYKADYSFKKTKYYIQNTSVNNTDIIFCGVYIPPENSVYFDDNIFIDLENNLLIFNDETNPIVKTGDFNSRTSNQLDFIDHLR